MAPSFKESMSSGFQSSALPTVQGVSLLPPDASWDRLQYPHDPEKNEARKWKDGCFVNLLPACADLLLPLTYIHTWPFFLKSQIMQWTHQADIWDRLKQTT